MGMRLNSEWRCLLLGALAALHLELQCFTGGGGGRQAVLQQCYKPLEKVLESQFVLHSSANRHYCAAAGLHQARTLFFANTEFG